MQISNLIIGAGPAGLAVAGRMRKQGIPFEVIEQSDVIASSWHQHYERLCLHTVKQLSNLPHLDFPEHYPLYVPRNQVVEYMQGYAKHFDIQPHFNQTVEFISKNEADTWTVKTQDKSYTATNVIIATGMNRIPNFPTFEGQKNFEGTIEHSRFYKNALAHKGKKVLVIGMGNSGAEIALDLCENGAETYLSVRGPISLVPRDLNGRPVQLTALTLAKIPFGLGDKLGNTIRKIYFGNIQKYGLEPIPVPPVIHLRDTGKTPVIDIGTMKAIKQGKIKVKRGIQHFSAHKVHFKDGTEQAINHIVMATGYRAKIEDFLERGREVLDDYGLPCPPVGTGFHQGIYFNGFDNYKLGGALGTIFNDSAAIVEDIKNGK